MNVLVLDAMGVIYSVGDDVRDLLCPFIFENRGITDISKIERLYHLASLGNISASEFWDGVNVDSRLEEKYLQRHRLSDGLIDFLEIVNSRGHEVWCLSNDLSEWSKKLRTRFGLDKYFRGFVISADVGVRKPDVAIFGHLCRLLNTTPHNIVFVDDQGEKLDSAATLGFNTVLYAPPGDALKDDRHQVATTFNDIISLLASEK